MALLVSSVPCDKELLAQGYVMGVTLAQLVKASVGQADVQRFEPHLGHNCGVFLVKSWGPFHIRFTMHLTP